MTVWQLYLMTHYDTNMAIFDTNKKEYLWRGKNCDMPTHFMPGIVINVFVNIRSELVICI